MVKNGRQQRIKDYVSDVVYGVNDDGIWLRDISIEYKQRNLTRIKQLNFTPETLCGGMQEISESLFCKHKANKAYIAALLIFSIELDTFYKQYPWYTTDLLIDILVSVLFNKTKFTPSYNNNNKCTILYLCFFSIFSLGGPLYQAILVWLCYITTVTTKFCKSVKKMAPKSIHARAGDILIWFWCITFSGLIHINSR